MGTRSELIGTTIADCKWRRGKYDEVMVVTGNIADNYALSQDMPPTVVLGASAARDVLMPANAASMHGLTLTLISNSSTTTGVLTLKTSADQALSPAVTIAQGASATLRYIHGTGWKRLS